jgi:hypothetical protein
VHTHTHTHTRTHTHTHTHIHTHTHQVHVATLRGSGERVAIKVQHPQVQDSAAVDLTTISVLLRGVRWLFPSVDYVWLATDAKRNIPLELDFEHQASNAERCASNFAHRSDVVVPRVFRSCTTRRVLTMSFEDGVSPTDLDGLAREGLSRHSVAALIASALNEQIFVHGFVHADPHPGNLLVRACTLPSRSRSLVQQQRSASLSSSSSSSWWGWVEQLTEATCRVVMDRLVDLTAGGPRVELVILDHGLYREVSKDLRLSYAAFWRAILRGDLEGMKACTDTLGAGELYPLLACAITRKPWHVIVGDSSVDADGVAAAAPPTAGDGRASSANSAVSANSTVSVVDRGGSVDTARQSLDRLTVNADSSTEVGGLQANVRAYITQAFAMLARVNPDMLLLLKTNDCVQHVLTALGSSAINYVYVEKWTSVALKEQRRAEHDNGKCGTLSSSRTSSLSSSPTSSSWSCWLQEKSLSAVVWIAEAVLGG